MRYEYTISLVGRRLPVTEVPDLSLSRKCHRQFPGSVALRYAATYLFTGQIPRLLREQEWRDLSHLSTLTEHQTVTTRICHYAALVEQGCKERVRRLVAQCRARCFPPHNTAHLSLG
jgi:hypothetical protein